MINIKEFTFLYNNISVCLMPFKKLIKFYIKNYISFTEKLNIANIPYSKWISLFSTFLIYLLAIY
jgi:hypothetical protein